MSSVPKVRDGADDAKLTTSHASEKASETVAAIPELLEQILLNLEPREVLRCLQVKKCFLSTTKGSPKLRQKIHYKKRDSHYPEWTLDLSTYAITCKPATISTMPSRWDLTLGNFNPLLLAPMDASAVYIPPNLDHVPSPAEILVNGLNGARGYWQDLARSYPKVLRDFDGGPGALMWISNKLLRDLSADHIMRDAHLVQPPRDECVVKICQGLSGCPKLGGIGPILHNGTKLLDASETSLTCCRTYSSIWVKSKALGENVTVGDVRDELQREMQCYPSTWAATKAVSFQLAFEGLVFPSEAQKQLVSNATGGTLLFQ